MRKITMSEMKNIELGILSTIAQFCDENNIRYYIAYGTLLGAVRHKGFIPWDDDIDIIVPREDYNKLVKEFKDPNGRYVIKSIENDPLYWRTFAKGFDTKTYLKEPSIRGREKDNAVFIDIFPLDGLPATRFQQKLLCYEQELLYFLYRGSAWSYTFSHKYADSKSKFATLKSYIRTAVKFTAITLFRILPTHVLIKLINKNAAKNHYDDAEYVGQIVDCSDSCAKERHRKIDFEPRSLYQFEDKSFWGNKNYDTILTHYYGNYMEMPPEDRRVTHHDFEAFWK